MSNESTFPTQRSSTPSPNIVPTDFTTIAGFTVFLLLIVFIIIGCLVLVLASKKGCCRKSNQGNRESSTEGESATSVNMSDGPPSYLEVTESNRNSTDNLSNQNRIFFCEVPPPPSYNEVMEALAQKKKEEIRSAEQDTELGSRSESRNTEQEEITDQSQESPELLTLTINQSDTNAITINQTEEPGNSANDNTISPENTVYTWSL
ncbi:unnamed protein product [Dimorphilus gyrociliatus]|uniref:Uncharacterized protein n=1 Tax=Dimorphilus gyrociliatus TaxID=2664684 RepID=A0A7I8VW78_9ANNE|nr:unnamed protein product [Dimorphilus gyrociliatus]